MASVRVVVHRQGVRDLLRSDKVLRILRGHGDRIAGKAGPGHRVESNVGRNRARVAVITDTHDARRREATTRDLTRAVR